MFGGTLGDDNDVGPSWRSSGWLLYRTLTFGVSIRTIIRRLKV